MSDSDILRLRIDASFQPVAAELRVYSAGFRRIRTVKWDAASITGHYDVSVPVSALGELGNGTYYYVLTLEGQSGADVRSGASQFIILR